MIDRPLDSFLKEVESGFDYPETPLNTVIAYGSGAFPQLGYKKGVDRPMVDFIFATKDPEAWHQANIARRPDDYSRAGHSLLVRRFWQNKGGGLWYNAFVNFEGREIKYGVIGSDVLNQDCRQWDRLYAAGRLQKPTNILRETDEFNQAQRVNLMIANRVALLLGAESFLAREHYEQIARLSFDSDIRMRLNYENPEKVQNILGANLEGFESLHGPFLEALEQEGLVARRGSDSDSYERDLSDEASIRLAKACPFKLPNDPQKIPAALRGKINRVVFYSSVMQPLKGLSTTDGKIWQRYLKAKKKKSRQKP